eukprot:TRINITY_DN13224_c0_g1_i2.p1 TRINITY_DN13224_c0_g1~~TRINITY_DN13224_c0_g1_i2.p1  ORF type:complete len:451 (-),score=74.04 TRINITY_DN13224_c0_g1_i2:33-1385(-)
MKSLLASASEEVDENVAQYIRWRKVLLLAAQHADKLQGHGGYGDRRHASYRQWREALIKKKQFKTHAQESSVDESKGGEEGNLLKKSSSSNLITEEMKAKMPGGGKVNDAYAFTGMHHIFAERTQAVNRIKFANEDKDLLAFSCRDGTITVCEAFFNPSIKLILKGHTKPVTDFDWSMTNEMIISTSLDQTIRVWDIKKGTTLRQIEEEAKSVPNCCMFYPLNNNLFFVGNSKGALRSINLSTGKTVQRLEISTCSIQTIEIDPMGTILFAGDSRGTLYIYNYSPTTGLRPQVKMDISPGKSITSLRYKGWYHLKDKMSELIANCQDGTLKLFSISKGVQQSTELIKYKKQFPCQNRDKPIRSCFCPLISIRDGACVVTGSSDCSIYIYNVKREGKDSCVNQFMGHADSVLDVSWNYDESLLASCDAAGVVILWKRILINRENPVEQYRD